MITLQDFNHLRDDPRVRFKSEIVNGVDLTIVCYMIADAEFWKLPLALECRGIVFDTLTGECVCRPLEKFFNVGERPETQKHLLDFEGCQLFEKRDGSMLLPVLVNDKVMWKTKKSFTSDVAISAACQVTADLELFCKRCLEAGHTPIFEYTDRQHQIVIDYGATPSLVLLGIRTMATGTYFSYEAMTVLAESYGVSIIPRHTLSVEDMFAEMSSRQVFEGYVVLLKNKIRVKQKTEWYLRMHVIMTSLRERDVAEAVINEMIDDIKSSVSAEGKDLSPLNEIEKQVVNQLDQLRLDAEALLLKVKECPTRKEAALMYQNDPSFSMAMKLYNDKEPDYKKIWVDRFYRSYSLKTVYSSFKGEE